MSDPLLAELRRTNARLGWLVAIFGLQALLTVGSFAWTWSSWSSWSRNSSVVTSSDTTTNEVMSSSMLETRYPDVPDLDRAGFEKGLPGVVGVVYAERTATGAYEIKRVLRSPPGLLEVGMLIDDSMTRHTNAARILAAYAGEPARLRSLSWFDGSLCGLTLDDLAALLSDDRTTAVAKLPKTAPCST